MELQIVNPDPRYSTVKLMEPTALGYLHVAAQVRPRSLPFLPNGREKSELLSRLKESVQHLAEEEGATRVTLFDAIAFAPPSAYVKEQAGRVHLAHFDIVVLIETTSPEVAHIVQTTPAYEALVQTLRSQATDMHILAARNAKRVGDVDKTREGVFLFNYF
ncbi:MAG TPA: hypothetical protein VKR06_11935, partial [Ktedonosporobacter sp.]|nr:hypothetical protein [Ktedonosporobacter sp.]